MRLRRLFTGGVVTALAAGAVGLVSSDASKLEARVLPSPRFSLEEKKEKARREVQAYMARFGVPGLSVAVAVDGRKVWSESFGFADVEHNVPFKTDTKTRQGSISKTITSTIAARLVDKGLLDLDAPIQGTYLKDYPELKFGDKAFPVTTRQLLSHTAGIAWQRDAAAQASLDRSKTEFFNTRPYKSVEESLERFKDEKLRFEPGTKFNYTTNGYTLASAVLEKAGGKSFGELVEDLCQEIGLWGTGLENNGAITPNRAYHRNSRHVLENAPEVDNSYKWAGGGILSTAEDLLSLLNAVFASAQSPNGGGFLRRETISDVLEGKHDIGAAREAKGSLAALGWFYVPSFAPANTDEALAKRAYGGYWYHVGVAVGASSVILFRPSNRGESVEDDGKKGGVPHGIAVAICHNLHDVRARKLAVTVEAIFRDD